MNFLASFRYHLLFAFEPLTRVIGKVHIKCEKHEITKEDIENIIRLVKPGDTIYSRNHLTLTNLFIPGWYKHAAMISSCGGVYEAVDPVCTETPLRTFLEHHCYVALMRDENLMPEETWRLTTAASKFLHWGYDYQLWLTNKKVYCIELLGLAYKKAFGFNPIPCRKVWGVDTMFPDDGRYCKRFKVVYLSTNAK
jgi:hypothetical protein